MSSRPVKRKRLDTDTDTGTDTDTDAVDPSKLPELVDSLSPRRIANLLISAANAYPDIAFLIQEEVDRVAAAERARVLDFDYLSKSAWRSLNVGFDGLRGWEAHEVAGEAAESIKGCIEEIRTCCPKTTNFKTKESALETLRKIGKSFCLSSGTLVYEIKNDYDAGEELVPVMLEIAKSLTDEEIERLRPWCDDKLVELQRIAHNDCVFEDLDEVIELWGGNEVDENEDVVSSDNNEEDEGESEDEEEAENEMFVAGLLVHNIVTFSEDL